MATAHLASADTRTLTCPLPSFCLYRHLPSHVHCPPLASAGICTNMPTAHFWSWHLDTRMHSTILAYAGILSHMPTTFLAREVSAQTWPLSTLASAGTCTHKHNVTSALCMYAHSHAPSLPLPSVRICAHIPTASLWSLPAPEFSYTIPISGLCKHLL